MTEPSREQLLAEYDEYKRTHLVECCVAHDIADRVPLLLEQVRVLEERIRRVREMRNKIECSNCDHPAKLHDNGRCAAVLSLIDRQVECWCDWGTGPIAEDIDAALDGEDEEQP